MQTSKSPKQTAQVAYLAAQKSLPLYSHEFSPKKFTQPQLVACLVLKEFFTTDYRGIVGILGDSSDLRKALELKEVPHYTTLQKAARRLFRKKNMRKLIAGILTIAVREKLMKDTIQLAAIDGTGFESTISPITSSGVAVRTTLRSTSRRRIPAIPRWAWFATALITSFYPA